MIKLEEQVFPGLSDVLSAEKVKLTSSSLLEEPLDYFKFTHRTENFLRKNYCKTIGDVVKYRRHELLNIVGCGKKTLKEIQYILAEYGLCLADDILISDIETRKMILNIPATLEEMGNSVRQMIHALRDIENHLEVAKVNMSR